MQLAKVALHPAGFFNAFAGDTRLRPVAEAPGSYVGQAGNAGNAGSVGNGGCLNCPS